METGEVLWEFTNIMQSINSSYFYLIFGENQTPPTRVLELAIREIDELAEKTRSVRIKEAFHKTKDWLGYLHNFPRENFPESLGSYYDYEEDDGEDYEDEEEYAPDLVASGLGTIISLGNLCCEHGMNIFMGKYGGRDVCKRGRYKAIAVSGNLKEQILLGELPENASEITKSLDSFVEQCSICPYRTMQVKKKKKTLPKKETPTIPN